MKISGRLLGGLILVALLFSIFTTGCGSSSNQEATTVATTKSVQTQSKAKADETTNDKPAFTALDLSIFKGGYGDTWDQILEKFKEKYPGVKITADIDPNNHERLRARLVSGNPPDIVNVNHGNFDLFGAIVDGQFRDLNDVFEDTVPGKDIKYKDLFKPDVINMCTFDGDIMLAPINTGFRGLIYNKKLFRDKGWDVPKNMDEFMALCAKIKADGSGIAPLCYQGVYPSYWITNYMEQNVSANGGNQAYLDAFINIKKGAWESAPVKKTIQSIKDMVDKGYIMKGTTALNHTQAQMELLNGRAAFVPCGTWFESEMKDSIPEDFEIGFVCPFVNSDGQTVVGTSQTFLSVPAGCKNYDAAKAWLQFCYTDESVQEIFCKHTQIPYVKDISESALSHFSESMQEIIKYGTADNATYVDVMIHLYYPTLATVIGENITLLVLGEESVDEFCRNVEAEAERIRNDSTILKQHRE